MATPVPAVGQMLGRYRLLEQIGAGGMGTVFRARDEHLGRDVAVKVISATLFDDADARRRFREEAAALSRLNHPNIQTLHDFGSEGLVDFLVAEFVPGISLDQKIRAGALPVEEVVDLAKQLSAALIAAHQQGIVHRDLKPSNLRLRPDGQLKVLDFGLAKIIEDDPSNAATTSHKTDGAPGTLPYMAPEVLRGSAASAVSDLYSTGVILYEMACGFLPHRESSAALVDAILNRAPAAPSALNPSIPVGLEQIILKALDKRADYRYQSARDLLVDLQRFQSPSGFDSHPLPTKRRKLGAFLTVGSLLLFISLGYAAYRSSWMRPTVSQGRIQSLAVLPLKNLSGDSSQQYFSEAMTEELTNELTSLSSLRVISRTSANRYAATSKSLPEIARELGVDAIIEGSVLRSKDAVRITVQLIDGATDQHLWSNSYERNADNVMAMQRDVAGAVAHEIHLKITPSEQQHLQSVGTHSPQAYEAYLRAIYGLDETRFSPAAGQGQEDVNVALQQAELATRLDPGFAEAYVAVATACSRKIFTGNGGKELDEKAFVSIARALAINPRMAEAYSTRGSLYYNKLHNFDIASAVADYIRAEALNPNLADPHHGLGSELTHLGLHDRAIEELHTTILLDPQSRAAKMRLSRALWQSNRFPDALANYEKYDLIVFERAVVLGYLGRVQEGDDVLRRMPTPKNNDVGQDIPAAFALLHALAGKKRLAEEEITKAARLGMGKDHFHHAAFLLAAANAELGNPHESVNWLRYVAEHGMPNYPLFRENPSMRKLHGNKEYEDYMKELKLHWEQIASSVPAKS